MNDEQNLVREDDDARLDHKPTSIAASKAPDDADLSGKRVLLNWIIMFVGTAAIAVIGKLLM